MVDKKVSKCVGLILIAAAQLIFNSSSRAEVTGLLGSNVTLWFRFNNTVLQHDSHFAVYVSGQRKIAECSIKVCPGGIFSIYPENTSVVYHITNLQLNHSEIYWASLFDSGLLTESNKVHLVVQEENRSSTVPPSPTDTTTVELNGTSGIFSSAITGVLLVLPVILLLAALPWFWCQLKANNKQQQQQQQQLQSSNVTVQECAEAPPPVYSILDFPQRPSAVLEMNSNNTEYAAISYLSEKRV
ncbi:uncharacterized protein LOC115042451 [Echeneis naucrates]|uniref:uncharacterized protein LOC115042451 n=1 Tax=Echeneis naucrates TaxID=173247 RepID=UPI0011136E8F|nr:uncharacterized protein LOC115042451 [Echeneis naucrates]XP_029356547.1 uncharacterized protein LOC115042451 [Echeneis naucrates]